MADRISGTDSARGPRGRFGKGNPGKPKGTRNRATQAVEKLLEGQAEALTERVVELALGGDTTALRLCLDRLAPPRRDSPVSFTLPPIKTSADLGSVTAALLQAVADGELTPAEAQGVGALVQTHARALEVGELSDRIAKLEGSK